MIKGVVNVFWFAFLADGLLSFFDEILVAKTGSSPLSVIRFLLAFAVLLMSVFMGVLVVFSRQPFKRVVVPMVLFAWWANVAEGYPLSLWNIPGVGFWMACGQLTLAVLLLVFFREAGSPWNEPFAVRDKPEKFAWKSALLTGFSLGAIALAVTAVGALTALARQIEVGTGGYVRLKPDGIYLVERKFHQGEKEVWLAGMVHVARKQFYSDVLPHGDPAIPSVVLVEGVTDHKGLLGQGTLRYTKLAKLLNMTAQEDSDYTQDVISGLGFTRKDGKLARAREFHRRADGIDFKHADVDVESFSPKTTAFIVAVMSVFQSDDLQDIVHKLSDPSSPINDQSAQNQVMQDILVSRNEKLVSEIESSLKDYQRVIVPWGAFHLSGIETWLLKHDFERESEVERKAVSFW